MSSNEFWAHHVDQGTEASLLMRIVDCGEGPAVTAVVILADDITSTTLKKLRIGTASLRDVGGSDNPFRWLLAIGDQPKAIRQLSGAIGAAFTVAARLDGTAVRPLASRSRLVRPDRTDPDGHSRSVAAAYEEAVRLGKQPGPTLAAEACVPIATAHGWIREARRRGHLPKARKGRVGWRPGHRRLNRVPT